MFINFFKSSFFSQYLVIGLTGLLLWSGAFIHPPVMPLPDGPVPLYQFLYDLLSPFPLAATILGFLLILGETYFLAVILSRHELVLKNSSLPALLFMVMMSLLPAHLTLTPVNISVAFLIMILYHILIYYNKPEHLDRVFAAGFFTSLAAMFYLPFILWSVFIIISLLVCRAGYWRAWMAAFIGILTPLIYLAVWVFWDETLAGSVLAYGAYFNHLELFLNPFHTDFYILGGYTVLLALWGLAWSGRATDKVVEIRAKSSVIMWTLFFVLVSLLYSRSLTVYHLSLAIPALAMLVTRALFGLRKTRLAETFLIIFFLAVLVNNLILHRFVYP